MLKKIFIVILLLCINLVSCSESKAVNSNNIEQSYKSTKAIELYVPDDNISKWVIEEEKVDISELKNVIVALKDTDKCCIPKDTKVNSIKIENKIAYVDLSKDFDDSQTGSSAAVWGFAGSPAPPRTATPFPVPGQRRRQVGRASAPDVSYPLGRRPVPCHAGPERPEAQWI